MLATGQAQNSCSPQLREHVLSKMASDDITAVARSDDTILIYGSALLEKRGRDKGNEVSQNMRVLARVVIEARELCGDNNATLSSSIAPKNFDMLLKCAKNLGGFIETEDGTKQYKSPSTSIKCGYALKKAALILRGQSLRDADMEGKKEVDMFLELYDSEWGGKITTPALGNLSTKKHNSPNLLPITNDLVALRKYLIEKILALTTQVSTNATRENFRELSEVSLARLIMFNKRRGGEAARMKINSFMSRPVWRDHHNEEIIGSLSSAEKQLCNRFDMVEIVGKRNRKVPVIITPDLKSALEVLTMKTTREKANVCEENQYVFPVNDGKSKYSLRGNDVLRHVCAKVKLENASAITSTNMENMSPLFPS